MAHRLWSISERVTAGMIKFRIDSSLIAILLCDTRRERRVTSVSGDNNNAVINFREWRLNNAREMLPELTYQANDEIESQHSLRFAKSRISDR